LALPKPVLPKSILVDPNPIEIRKDSALNKREEKAQLKGTKALLKAAEETWEAFK
jgi:hypothetical protein